MIFSCTKKVSEKLKKYKTCENAKEETSFLNWYMDMLTLKRKNYFLFTHSQTLFSFFIYAGTKKEFQNIEVLFEKKLKQQIVKTFGFQSAAAMSKLFPKVNNHRFVKTNSRSILGSMNDFKFHIQANLHYHGGLTEYFELINLRINEIPMGALKLDSPKERMQNELNLEIRNTLN